MRRAASYADLYDLVSQHVLNGKKQGPKKRNKTKKSQRGLDALLIISGDELQLEQDALGLDFDLDSEDELKKEVLDAGQYKYSYVTWRLIKRN